MYCFCRVVTLILLLLLFTPANVISANTVYIEHTNRNASGFSDPEAQSSPSGGNWNYRLAAYVDELGQRRQSTYNYPASDENGSCRSEYDKLFEDDVLKINLAFGYADTKEGVTSDKIFFDATAHTLKRHCRRGRYVCGFKETNRNNNTITLEKNLRRRQGFRNKKIKITMAYSSRTPNDVDNFRAPNQISMAQRSYTQKAKSVFFDGIAGRQSKCEMCVYYGHSRGGGGPDFRPVPHGWRKRNNSPNYWIYREHQLGYKKMIESLLDAGDDPPQLLALFSCKNYKHFYRGKARLKKGRLSLEHFAEQTGFILTPNLTNFAHWHRLIGTFLDAAIGLKCKSAWQKNFKDRRLLINDTQVEQYDIYGEFL
mgnify:CR=1 FL=1